MSHLLTSVEVFYYEWCVQQYVLRDNVHGFHSGKEGQSEVWQHGIEDTFRVVILESIWIIITSGAILRLKELT